MSYITTDYKNKARTILLNTPLRDLSTQLEMYLRSVGLELDQSEMDEILTRIVGIYRWSETPSIAINLVNHYLDLVEEKHE